MIVSCNIQYIGEIKRDFPYEIEIKIIDFLIEIEIQTRINLFFYFRIIIYVIDS
jgi:hypothetical protein